MGRSTKHYANHSFQLLVTKKKNISMRTTTRWMNSILPWLRAVFRAGHHGLFFETRVAIVGTITMNLITTTRKEIITKEDTMKTDTTTKMKISTMTIIYTTMKMSPPK